MQKTILILFLTLLLFGITLNAPMVLAQETSQNPGITPDSALWGIDTALEQVSLFLITSPEAKSIKGIEIAEERLAEIKEMIEENKLDAAEKAEESHGKALAGVQENIEEIEKDDSTEEMKEVIEIEKELQDLEDEVEQVFGELKIKIKIEGEITEEQQALIDSILASLEGQTGEVEIEIENKKDKTKIKIEIETGMSDEEVEDEVEKLEVEGGVAGIEVEAEIIGSQSEVKIEREFSTTTTDRDAIIDEIIAEFALDREIADAALEIGEGDEDEGLGEKFKVEVEVEEEITKIEVKLKFILDATDRDAILTAVVGKSRLTKTKIESVLKFEVDDEDEELEIEVEIEDGIARVKVELAGEDFEFTLETTDRDEIISEIMDRIGLTREQIEGVMEFEVEDEEEKENGRDEDNDEEDDKGGEDSSGFDELQDCSRVPGEIIECSEGYFCYDGISGGLGGFENGSSFLLPIEHVSGDNKCHKLCEEDSDCLEGTPRCTVKDIQTADYVEKVKLCFNNA